MCVYKPGLFNYNFNWARLFAFQHKQMQMNGVKNSNQNQK